MFLKIKNYFIFFLLLANIYNISAQGYPERKEIAKQNIKNLKNGVLFVRLKTQENKIFALREKGAFSEAEKVIKKQKVKNISIIKAFSEFYNFSSVYFFESQNTNKVLNGDFDNIFLDDSMKSVNFAIEQTFFLIAEFGVVEPDTNTYSKKSYYDSNTKEQREVVYGDTRMGISALVVRDRNLIQLKEPFPYYTRLKSGFWLERKAEDVVREFNMKLIRTAASFEVR